MSTKMALEGIKVIDGSQVAAVPIAARNLGDFGADVIHVENTEGGDYMRVFQETTSETGGAPVSDFNYCWETYNRNKRSMSLDLNHIPAAALLSPQKDSPNSKSVMPMGPKICSPTYSLSVLPVAL